MSGIRDELLAKKIRSAVPRRIRLVMDLCKSILSGMPEIPVIPDSSIIPSLQPFQDMIKNTPYDQDLLEDDFAEAVTTLPDICASWRQQQENELQSKLSALGRDADLSLAANAFTCAHCSSHPVLHYPYFASHGCFIVRSNIDGILTTSWDYTRIKAVDEDIRTKCEDIIRLCGLDPASATIQDLDATDAFFRCDYCQTRLWQPLGSKVSYLMRWRAAMVSISKFAPAYCTDAHIEPRALWKTGACYRPRIPYARQSRDAFLVEARSYVSVVFSIRLRLQSLWRGACRPRKSGGTSAYCVSLFLRRLCVAQY